MLDALKDLYSYHPFLPVAIAPDWFSHIKDIHCTVTLPAENYISKYKINGNFVRVWLYSISATKATLRIRLPQLRVPNPPPDGYTIETIRDAKDILVDLAICRSDICPQLEPGVPVTAWPDNYLLADPDLFDDQGNFMPPTMDTEYELNPDILVIMQQAPMLYVGGIQQGVTLNFLNGYNVSVSDTNNGILFYGGAGVGKGKYTLAALDRKQRNPVKEYQAGIGLRNINGITGAVQIDGTFPVRVEIESIRSAPTYDDVTGQMITVDTMNKALNLSLVGGADETSST